ncbi:hypothetical protein GYH30_039458 [Glycine max]|nr:hypothetical protein GYH30_039458 [Glycine max]
MRFKVMVGFGIAKLGVDVRGAPTSASRLRHRALW